METENNKGTDRKPTILQVLPALETGGVERGTVDVAAAQIEAGFNAVVASAGGRMVRELERIGATHVKLPLDTKSPFGIYRNIARLEKLIREMNVDIVHARSRAPAWSAWYATKRAQTPFVTTFHGTYNAGSPFKKLYNSVMTRGDRVIAISDFIRRHMLGNYRTADADRITVIHRGIDAAIFNPEAVSAERVIKLSTDWRLPDGVPVIMLSGRMTRWKGQLLLLDALKKLEGRPMRCLFVGSAQGRESYVREVEERARNLCLEGIVHIVGDCLDMPAAYKIADVVVSASTDPEAFGRVAVEGQAMGRPVVAPRHGGAQEQIEDGVTGWLFEPGDADDLARALQKALDLTEAERAALHERAIENVQKHFTRERMCEATIKLYREILDRAIIDREIPVGYGETGPAS